MIFQYFRKDFCPASLWIYKIIIVYVMMMVQIASSLDGTTWGTNQPYLMSEHQLASSTLGLEVKHGVN